MYSQRNLLAYNHDAEARAIERIAHTTICVVDTSFRQQQLHVNDSTCVRYSDSEMTTILIQIESSLDDACSLVISSTVLSFPFAILVYIIYTSRFFTFISICVCVFIGICTSRVTCVWINKTAVISASRNRRKRASLPLARKCRLPVSISAER